MSIGRAHRTMSAHALADFSSPSSKARDKRSLAARAHSTQKTPLALASENSTSRSTSPASGTATAGAAHFRIVHELPLMRAELSATTPPHRQLSTNKSRTSTELSAEASSPG